MNKVNSVLKEVVEDISLDKSEIKRIGGFQRDFIGKLEKEIKKSKIDADVFLGGSFAKDTMIKKDVYDVDIFLRFGKKHIKNNISDITSNLLKKFKGLKIKRVHGSRDYFRIKISNNLLFEIVPVKKIRKPSEAENITDLSFSHVKYIKGKIKKSKVSDQIKLAKVFCHANKCYGAESYIRGFSGYALELLIYRYGSFSNFIKAMIKIKDEKLVIDIEKFYKSRERVLLDINESKLQSPVILVDPTYKTRNVLAALSDETFRNFQKACKKFLKKPAKNFFERREIDFNKIKRNAERNKNEFIVLEAKTNKQEGDIAGSKLRKFYNQIESEISEYFEIKKKGFEYNQNKTANYYFVVENRGQIIIEGPRKKQKEHVKRFKKKHKRTFSKKGHIYSKKKVDFTINEFVKNWKLRSWKKLKEMSILNLSTI